MLMPGKIWLLVVGFLNVGVLVVNARVVASVPSMGPPMSETYRSCSLEFIPSVKLLSKPRSRGHLRNLSWKPSPPRPSAAMKKLA